MNTLTKEQAITRIKGIKRDEQTLHLRKPTVCGSWRVFNSDRVEGAILELMAIFDIKEEELL